MSDHTHTPDETIGDIVNPDARQVSADEPLDAVMDLLGTGEGVIFVTPEPGSAETGLLGILTKIDVLDYIATHCL
jgi:predicted transcriptional regulator